MQGGHPQTAGPFLKYINCLPGSREWRGSVLFLTFDTAPQPAAPTLTLGPPPPSKGAGAPATAAPQPEPQHPTLLDTVLGWSFWRFDLSLELGPHQREVQYTVTPPHGAAAVSAAFWLPAAGQPFHWAYTSCNGISSDAPDDHFARQDPTYLWRDLLQVHAAFPMHALVGGGDQVYSDPVWEESGALQEWSAMEDMDAKVAAPWTATHQAETTAFYLRNYLESFTQPDVSTAYASIPSVMVWDDHDIWDGWGSYDAAVQGCPIFQNLFHVARRFYLLFQQHTTLRRAQKGDEFLHHVEGFHSVRYMGPGVALLCIDMRSKRTKRNILPESTYQLLRSTALDLPACVEHVVVLSGVPLIFPNIPFSEVILRGVKGLLSRSACLRSLAASSFLSDRFGQPEILDDLLDGWAAKVHGPERVLFIRLLQEVALAKHVRVTILSGDAHVGGVGRLYTRRHPALDPGEDPLYMAQIISSAIMNAPPPLNVVKMLMRTNFAKNIDDRTRQKMVRAFWPTHPRTDKLLARRNWCDVSSLTPGAFAAPGNPADPALGGLRFALRVENPELRKGYAEEVYEVLVPRAPPLEGGKAGRGHWHHMHAGAGTAAGAME